MSAPAEIGEINPGEKNPGMSPGHNNAVYVYVKDTSGKTLAISSLRLFTFWSEDQGKYKYGLEINTANNQVTDPPAPEQNILIPAGQMTNNFYWQGGVEKGKALCKTGISASLAESGVIVFFDTNSAELPPQ